MKIDLFAFARLKQSASGTTSLQDLPRVETVERDGALAWVATGSMNGRHGAPRLDLSVDGEVTLICQRCLQPLQEPIAIRSRFLIAADEATAEALDQDDAYDVVVADAEFELDTLIEDEVILALPSAPRHRVCPTSAAIDVLKIGRPSPFAALAVLKVGGATDGDGSKH
jgi:uncharacterized protein